MSLVLYNAAVRQKEIFKPSDPQNVRFYVCGPTVYSYPHIGNARSAVAFDLLYRVLRWIYGKDHVLYARNLTDIDDKIIRAAAEKNISWQDVATQYTQIYHQDMAALGVLSPGFEPKATDHIEAMQDLMTRLIKKGHAYEAEGHVLFHTPSFSDYGALSGRSREDMIAGARIETAPYKQDPSDFVLWKPSKPGEPFWPSPWGDGRPGWHLECSAMIRTCLGETIDIHGGGQDLLFPHHENERAQSHCAHGGRPLARFWTHNGFVRMNSEKMAKSLGNIVLIHDLLKKAPGEVIRYALLSAHYRQPLEWTDTLMQNARRALDRLYRRLASVDGLPAQPEKMTEEIETALYDDLNTPKAFAALHQASLRLEKEETQAGKARAKSALLQAGQVLGFLEHSPKDWFAGTGAGVSEEDIMAHLEEREAARRARDFTKADHIRDSLAEQGIVLEDGPDGVSWRRV